MNNLPPDYYGEKVCEGSERGRKTPSGGKGSGRGGVGIGAKKDPSRGRNLEEDMRCCGDASEVELTNRSLRFPHIAGGSGTKRRISGKRRMGCQGRPQRSKRASTE